MLTKNMSNNLVNDLACHEFPLSLTCDQAFTPFNGEAKEKEKNSR